MAADKPKETLQERAVKLFNADWKTVAIAKELGVHSGTIRRWFKKLGLPPRKNDRSMTYEQPEELHPDAEVEFDADELARDLEDNLEKRTKEAILSAQHDARTEEDAAILAIAESQSTPADKYQHYIAAASIKLMRDNLKNLRGPRTVKDLDQLDQIIRRSLGLNAKIGGHSKMQIDISILNNTKADKGAGSVQPIIDIEPNDK
jgi:transposase-like protein